MNDKEKRRDGRTVLIWIVGFFLTFMAVDAFFVYKALETHPDVVEKEHGR